MAHEDFDKLISAKPEYTKETLLKQVSSKYYSTIKIFMKSNVDVVAEHREKWNHKIHLEKNKKTPFVQNYKLLLDQKIAAIKKYIDEHLGRDLFGLAHQ